MTLASPATSLVRGTVVNINDGTLNSNSATALGSLATVNVAFRSQFQRRRQSSRQRFNGAGAVNLAGNGSPNTLTIGSTDNLSSNFFGSISGVGGSLTVSTTGTVAPWRRQ